MKQIGFYCCALLVIFLSQLCEPRLTPWHPGIVDALCFLLAFAGAVALVAYGATRRTPTMALLAVFLQIALIRYNFVRSDMLGTASTSDAELLAINVVFVAGYVFVVGLIGVAIARQTSSPIPR